ncbi:site-specific tyrosine recombinase XerD [soil metagenome]
MTAKREGPSLLGGAYGDPRDLGPNSTTEDLARAYLQDQQDRGRGERTLLKYEAHLRTFLEFLDRDGGPMRIRDLDLRTLKAYATHLGRRRKADGSGAVSAATKNLQLIVVRGMLRFGVVMDLPVPGPEKVALARAVAPSPDARHLETGRLQRLLAAPPAKSPDGVRDRALLELLLATGCRISEVIALDRDKVELDPLAAEPKDGIRIAEEITVFGKGRRHRRVYLGERAREWLARYLGQRKDRDAALFVTRRRNADGSYRMSVWMAERIVRSAARRAGLTEEVSPHWLRHAAITDWATAWGLPSAQRLAGHQSIASTNRYLGGSDAELKALYKRRFG